MSALWTAADAAAATGGRAVGSWTAEGVSIDTRSLAPGDLFVALTDVRDGHDFVADALAKGAAAAMVSRVPDGLPEGAPLLIVDDVLAALGALGAAGRARSAATVVAITGSVGKTSTKEMLRDVLAAQGKVHAAEKSFNNHWGVPLTLARLPRDAEYAIIEIGMNRPGEIAPLSQHARPHIAVVTAVAAAHLEAFDDLSGIAREKASIFEGLEPGGTAIYNADVDTAPILRAAAEAAAETVIAFGRSPDTGARLADLKLTADASILRAEIAGTPYLVRIGAPGAHFAMNALAVLAVVDRLGCDLDVAACDLGRWSPPSGRGTRETLALDVVDDHLTIDLIDDAFNANPASMAAALEVLAAIHPVDDVGRVSKGRRIAILGDMLELGPDETRLHAEIAEADALTGVAIVHCVGPRMAALWEALPERQRGLKVETAEELAAQAHGLVDAGDVVLVKGSKGSRVSIVVDAIRKLGHPVPRNSEGAE